MLVLSLPVDCISIRPFVSLQSTRKETRAARCDEVGTASISTPKYRREGRSVPAGTVTESTTISCVPHGRRCSENADGTSLSPSGSRTRLEVPSVIAAVIKTRIGEQTASAGYTRGLEASCPWAQVGERVVHARPH